MYKEDCYDLLTEGKPKVELRETNKGEILVENITKCVCTSESEVFQLLNTANKHRSTSATAMNNQSSRSHAILTVSLSITKSLELEPGEHTRVTLLSKLNIVDLAGSERIKKTGASGDTLKEGNSGCWRGLYLYQI